MTTKNFGAGVSPYLDVDGRNFETTVYQQSKPVLDSELNQIQDIGQARGRSIVQLAQSGWLSGDLLNSSDHASGIFLASGAENELALPAMTALVNGWLISVNNTGFTGTDYDSMPGGGGDDVLNLVANRVNLGAPPAGAGALRTDLVILEVWRRLLSASPSTDGKSDTARIWRHGNVKIASGADDLGLNYEDDILNANVGAETTKRVQVQYRLRVVQGVDLAAYPSGIADPAVVATSVPATPDAPDGDATAFTYASRSPGGDGGLWRAGDGDPSNDLGTVDGYMYALPLVAVFRRNSAAFARDTNHNGGFGRPDGLTAGTIDARDVIDLRTCVSTTGWDLQELLQKNVNLVFDNALCTEFATTPLGGGSTGHTNIWADEIGPTDNPGAQRIRQSFDGVCRTFSDRPILETVTVRFVPTDQEGGGATWAEGSKLTIDPAGSASPFRIYPYATANYAAAAPSNIVILDVLSIVSAGTSEPHRVVGSYVDPATGAYHALDGGAFYAHHVYITGLGAPGAVEITLNCHPNTLPITGDLYVTLLVSYPGGADPTAGGLTKTPVADYGTDSFVVETPAQLPASAPYLFESLEASIEPIHREVRIEYHTAPTTFQQQVAASSETDFEVWSLRDLPANTVPVFVPERVLDTPAPTLTNTTTGDVYTGSVILSEDGNFLFVDERASAWSLGNPISTGDIVEVEYQTIRPIPNNNVQLTIYYEARAPQTVRTALLGTSLRVIPRYVAPHLFTIAAGSGSFGEGYPFPMQYVQGPGVYPSSAGTFAGDHELDGVGVISVADFGADTGFLQLPVMVPAVPQPQSLTFLRVGGDVDAEGRSYFKEVGAGYIPSAFAQPLSTGKRHKNVLPMIAELAEDGPIGPRGTLLMVLLSRWTEFDDRNFVGFDPDLSQNFTSASVYRLKGGPLSARRS